MFGSISQGHQLMSTGYGLGSLGFRVWDSGLGCGIEVLSSRAQASYSRIEAFWPRVTLVEFPR